MLNNNIKAFKYNCLCSWDKSYNNFILAESEEEARKIIIEERIKDNKDPYKIVIEEVSYDEVKLIDLTIADIKRLLNNG